VASTLVLASGEHAGSTAIGMAAQGSSFDGCASAPLPEAITQMSEASDRKWDIGTWMSFT